jgi:hypothetical protein
MGEENFYVYNPSLGGKYETNSITIRSSSDTDNPIIVLKDNGDILVKGKLIDNDIELVNALREFLKESGFLK